MKTRGGAFASAFVEASAVLAVWAGALLAEDVAIAFLWRSQFSGPWEISEARHVVGPIALAALVPLAALAAGLWRAAVRAEGGSAWARRGFAVLGALAAGALALGVTEGRHFASWAARGPFLTVMVLGGAAAGRWGVPRLAALARAPVALGLLGLGLALGGWSADGYVLPRLYPAFHLAMLGVCLAGGALAGLSLRAGATPPGRGHLAMAGAVAAMGVACVAFVPRAVRELGHATNLRIVLVEHAPLMGRAVSLVTAFEVEPPAGAAALAASEAPSEVARSLDWTGHDLVLISVDALRADHVGAYGYARPTTPNLDALAAEGTRFDDAYCPTPHTSYSLTSMMTGKYLRPLLALGLGEDSETWAQHLRRYGWRTGAFYPPAVFFIDEDRFTRFEAEHMGFEYAKVEFADPALREAQVTDYVASAPADRPLFLWVHFFEPHEPYVMHPEHPFSGGPSPDVDAYDSEVATADDGIGRIMRVVRARRPGAVFIVTADHGEEFGEHGGRYHGTTVYDEQVRVPLVVSGAGVRANQRVSMPVQTIDLLPTALSALGIPRPARLRGRDLGPLLAGAGEGKPGDEGRAFAETDDYELLASGPDRLICQRRAGACALYRPGEDPLERKDLSAQAPERFEAMRALLRQVARDHGRYESAGVSQWPEPLRRGLQGEADAAEDVAALLDDAEVTLRRKAAEVSFDLHVSSAAPQVRRAFAADEDDEVRRWSALALARMGDPSGGKVVDALLHDANRDWRRRAALALGERGDGRGCDEIAAWWSDAESSWQENANGEPPRLGMDLVHARELLAATSSAKCRTAVPALCRALADVTARPYLADALGALGDDRARKPLLQALANEPYVTTRPREARALLALGVRDSTWAPAGAADGGAAAPEVHATVAVPPGPARLVVLLSDADAALSASADGQRLGATGGGEPQASAGDPGDGEVRRLELGAARGRVRLDLAASKGGIVAFWVIPLDAEPRRD